MIYQLDMNIKPEPLLPWIYVFMCLSVKQFSLVYDKLDFPFDPPEEVRQLAHDFAFTDRIMRWDSEHTTLLKNLLHHGETASINLLKGALPNASYEWRRHLLFTNTFWHLERMGYAEAVYRWGKQTYTYYKYSNRPRREDLDALSDWCVLLRHWAISDWLRQPLSPEQVPGNLYSTDWEVLATRNAHIYTNLTFEPIPLSHESRTILQAIVLHSETEKLHHETTIEQIMASPKSLWEDFALGPGVASLKFSSEGRLRLNLREWSMILDTLSAEEMDILGQWALKDTYKWHWLKVPLPDFRVAAESNKQPHDESTGMDSSRE